MYWHRLQIKLDYQKVSICSMTCLSILAQMWSLFREKRFGNVEPLPGFSVTPDHYYD
jgi:hypothetical protein